MRVFRSAARPGAKYGIPASEGAPRLTVHMVPSDEQRIARHASVCWLMPADLAPSTPRWTPLLCRSADPARTWLVSAGTRYRRNDDRFLRNGQRATLIRDAFAETSFCHAQVVFTISSVRTVRRTTTDIPLGARHVDTRAPFDDTSRLSDPQRPARNKLESGSKPRIEIGQPLQGHHRRRRLVPVNGGLYPATDDEF